MKIIVDNIATLYYDARSNTSCEDEEEEDEWKLCLVEHPPLEECHRCLVAYKKLLTEEWVKVTFKNRSLIVSTLINLMYR